MGGTELTSVIAAVAQLMPVLTAKSRVAPLARPTRTPDKNESPAPVASSTFTDFTEISFASFAVISLTPAAPRVIMVVLNRLKKIPFYLLFQQGNIYSFE